jgi:hypothetical protein
MQHIQKFEDFISLNENQAEIQQIVDLLYIIEDTSMPNYGWDAELFT